jgi:glycolate oxidase iron-sulfur subunit
MYATLASIFQGTPEGLEAGAILGKCVHCGFCTATCPTYQLLGDELDGPRGRIYLVKQTLESGTCTDITRVHLDRCLTCRSCETTCPSGVAYGRLLEIARPVVERLAPRPLRERLLRWLLRQILLGPWFAPLLAFGRAVRWALPQSLARHIPRYRPAGQRAAQTGPRAVLMLEGCVQPAMAPAINAAAGRVLARFGFMVVPVSGAGCCGALDLHLGAPGPALKAMRRNIDAWWPHVENGVEAIVMTASGCGVTVGDYGKLLENDPAYAAKAKRVSGLTRDISELLEPLAVEELEREVELKVAFQSPCTLQHGQKITGKVEDILRRAGLTVVPTRDGHLCCGAAGTYSLLQPVLSRQLLKNKLENLERHSPDVIATANIGCLAHLESASSNAVCHWIELLDPDPPSKPGSALC